MNYIFDKNKISLILNDIAAITDVTVSFFDTSFKKIAESDVNDCEFCRLVRSTDDGAAGCTLSDRRHFAIAAATGESHTYTCHAGLCETVIPIYSQSALIGFMMFGRYRDTEGKNSTIEKVDAFCRGNRGSDISAMGPAYGKLPLYSVRSVISLSRIIGICLRNICDESPVQLGKNRQLEEITDYIDANFTENISIDFLCRKFYISSKSLYSLFRKYLDCTVLEYIERKRIDKAESLLSNRFLEIKTVAAMCGYSDYNYFIRVFKKVAGITPHAFRRYSLSENPDRKEKT